MNILALLSAAGPMPLAELNMRSPESPEELLAHLKALIEQGLVEVQGGPVPETTEELRTARSQVRLTTTGTRRAFR